MPVLALVLDLAEAARVLVLRGQHAGGRQPLLPPQPLPLHPLPRLQGLVEGVPGGGRSRRLAAGKAAPAQGLVAPSVGTGAEPALTRVGLRRAVGVSVAPWKHQP